MPVMSICGSTSVVALHTTSMSFASREATSPECSSSPLKSCRRNRLLNIRSRSMFVCRVFAITDM